MADEGGRKGPLLTVLAALLIGGAAARVRAFRRPEGFLFDEHHFVENARNYLAQRPDVNDHPPLGKLVLAGSMRLFGDGPFGWRLPSLVLGALTVVAAGLAAARLFRSRFAGAAAAALVAADGFFIAYSRAGLLDGQLAALAALSLLLVTAPWGALSAAAAGLLLGAACCVKFSGVGLLPLFAAALLLDEARSRNEKAALAALLGASAAATYVGAYAWGLSLAGQPASPGAVVAATRRLLAHHAALTDMKNNWVSGWPTWFVPVRPIALFRDEQLGAVRMVTSLGNLATWWAASAAFAAALGWVLRDGLRAVARRPAGRPTIVLLSTALGFLAPWVLTHRDSYLYHYLPSYLALVVLAAGALAALRERRPRWALAFLCAVLVVGAAYAPLWSGMPVGAKAASARLFLPGWR